MRTLVVALALVAGCGSSPTQNSQPLHDVEAATRALDRAVGLSTALVTAGNVNVGATPDIVAGAVANRLSTEAPGCGSVTKNGASLDVDFGASCALETASMHVGGTVHIDVAKSATSGMDVTATLETFTIDDGATLGGTFVISTTNGDAFTYAGMLTLDGVTVNVPLVVAGIAGGGATLDAMNATANGASLTLASLHQRFAACYPDEGDATLDTLGVAFDSTTPQTGKVTLSTGATATLPSRSGCPK